MLRALPKTAIKQAQLSSHKCYHQSTQQWPVLVSSCLAETCYPAISPPAAVLSQALNTAGLYGIKHNN
jgi:hypothetical protein